MEASDPSFCPILARYSREISLTRSRIEGVFPDLVVGVARKGPRLAELSAQSGSPVVPPGILFVFHKALPYIPHHELVGKRVVVLDDAVIWGSTMADIVSHPTLKESVVFPVSLIAAKQRDTSLLPGLQFGRELDEDEVMSFSVELVRSFSLLCKPY